MSTEDPDLTALLQKVEEDLDKLEQLVDDFSNSRRDKKKEHKKHIRQCIETIRDGINKSSNLLRSQHAGKQWSDKLREYSQRFRQLSKVARDRFQQDKNTSNLLPMSETSPLLVDQTTEMARPSSNRPPDQSQQLTFAREFRLHSDEEFIRQREEDIVKVGHELGIIKGLYQEFDELVNEQQEDLDQISVNVQRTRDSMDGANVELQTAQKSMIANRKNKCRMVVGLLIVLALLVFILTMKHPWKLPSNLSGAKNGDPQTS